MLSTVRSAFSEVSAGSASSSLDSELIGSIRHDWLDHVLVFNERGLRRILKSYFDYYERSRTHLSLKKDAPIPRSAQPPSLGRVIALPQVRGLHYRYERSAA